MINFSAWDDNEWTWGMKYICYLRNTEYERIAQRPYGISDVQWERHAKMIVDALNASGVIPTSPEPPK